MSHAFASRKRRIAFPSLTDNHRPRRLDRPAVSRAIANAQGAALAEIGPGANSDAHVQERAPGQATGKAGKEFPEEFKSGLDAYFNALEAGQK